MNDHLKRRPDVIVAGPLGSFQIEVKTLEDQLSTVKKLEAAEFRRAIEFILKEHGETAEVRTLGLGRTMKSSEPPDAIPIIHLSTRHYPIVDPSTGYAKSSWSALLAFRPLNCGEVVSAHVLDAALEVIIARR